MSVRIHRTYVWTCDGCGDEYRTETGVAPEEIQHLELLSAPGGYASYRRMVCASSACGMSNADSASRGGTRDIKASS